MSARVDQIVAEIGGIEPDEKRPPIRKRLHALESSAEGVRLVRAAFEQRGGVWRRWATFAFAGVAAVGALQPWRWLP